MLDALRHLVCLPILPRMLKRLVILVALVGINLSTSAALASDLVPGRGVPVPACVSSDPVSRSGLALSAEAEARALGNVGELPFDVVPSRNVSGSATLVESGIYQFIGTVASNGSGSIEVRFEHRDKCTLQPLAPSLDEFGRFTLRSDGEAFEVGAPWAITEAGDDLRTRFELRGGNLSRSSMPPAIQGQ